MGLLSNMRSRVQDLFIEKMAGFMALELSGYPQGTAAEDQKRHKFKTYIDAATRSAWIYAGARALAISAPKPPLKLYERIKEDGIWKPRVVEDTDLNRLVRRPNDFLTWRELVQITVFNMAVTGNLYWNLVGSQPDFEIGPNNLPLEIWWVKPEQMEIWPGKDPDTFIDYYEYKTGTGQGKKLHTSEVVHYKLVNPDSYFLGLGSVEPAELTATMEFQAISFNKNFLKNDGVPPGYFVSPDKLKKELAEKMVRKWSGDHSGPDKAGVLGFLYGGVDFKELGSKPKDAQYTELRKMNREEILASLGVPPSVVGLLEYANYSNMEVQQRKFWEDAVIPILDLVADKMTLNIAVHFNPDYWFEFDYSKIPALQEDQNQLASTTTNLVNSGVMTRDEVRSRFYGLDPLPDGVGSIVWQPINLVPASSSAPTNGDGEGDKKQLPAKKDGEPELSFWERGTRKKIFWTAFEKRIKSRERRVAEVVADFLKDQARKISNKLDNYDSITAAQMNIDKVIDIEKEAKRYGSKTKAYYNDALIEGGNAGLEASEGKIYDPKSTVAGIFKDDPRFELRPEYQEELRLMIYESGTLLSTDTLGYVVDKIKEAAENNWTVQQMSQEVFKLLDDYSAFRSRRIARTEMSRVENWGQILGYDQSEFVELKGWLSAYTKDTRQAHKDADAQYSAAPIPLKDPFIVDGEELQYPGDYRGSAGNVINCLCTTFPVVKEY